MNSYWIRRDGTLALVEDAKLPKRPYTYRGLGDSRKSRKYQNARRRALQKLREHHPEEYEALFSEQLRRYGE